MVETDPKGPPAVFDQFSESYEAHLDTPALRMIGGASSRAFIQLKCMELLRYLRERGIDPSTSTVLDAGCGTGISEEYLSSSFRRMIGVDLSAGMVQEAQRKGIANAEFRVSDAATIDLPDHSVQVMFSFCIFHHADPQQLTALLAESMRLLTPGGILAIFEHNPWNPLTRYIVSRCPVDVGVTLIPPPRLLDLVQKAEFESVEKRFLVFFPRSLKPFLRLEPFLSWCPIGGQYAVIAQKPI